MANPITPRSRLAWTLFAVSALGMIIFAALYFSSATRMSIVPTRPIRMVMKTVTNTVIITNEVPMLTPLSDEQRRGIAINEITNASGIDEHGALYNMKDVKVHCLIDDDVRKCVSEESMKAKFELVLRHNGIQINPKSLHVVNVNIGGCLLTQDNKELLYTTDCEVDEQVVLMRQGEMHVTRARVWNTKERYGVVSRDKAEETIGKAVESFAEIFSNDFLSANPKPKEQ